MRTVRNSPGFTLIAVLTLALGIGANTALFSVVDAVLLRSFGYTDPARLIEISGVNKKGQNTGVSLPDFQAFQSRARSLEQVGVSRVQTFTLAGGAGNGPREPENLYGQMVSRDCFAALGSAAILGRTFNAADFDTGTPLVAVIAYPLWRASFGGDSQMVGRHVLMNGADYAVIGVMGPDFQFPHPAFKVWAPWKLSAEDLANRTAHPFTLVARLKRGVTPAAALAELQGLSQSLAHEFPATNDGWRAVTAPVNERVLGNVRPALLTLLGAVGFVLLIACMNVSNLLVSRGIPRRGEMAVRAALGATRMRLVRQLLGESLVIAGFGGALGLLFAYWGLRALVASLPVRTISILPGLDRAGLGSGSAGGRVLLVSVLASLASAIVFGLFPALQLSRPNIEGSLKEGGRATTASVRGRRFLSGLIVLETALSVVLLVGAGLMIRSFARTMQVNLGFRPEHVLTAQIPSPWDDSRRSSPEETARQMQYFRQIVKGVQGIPGVSAAGLVTVLPLGVVHIQTRIFIHGRPAPGPGEDIRVQYRGVSPDYFGVMGIPVLRGRGFTEDDRTGQPAVVVVNQAMARAFWPNEDAVGKQISMGNPTTGPWITVVGVVAGVRHDRLTAEPEPELYTSYLQTLLAPQVSTVVLRTADNPLSLATTLRAAIHQINPNQPVAEVKTMTQVVSDSVAQPRLYTVLLAIFAALALLLAAAGIFAVISCTVNQSTHEIGIRMALGATPAHVLRAMMRRAVVEAAVGAGFGLAIAAGLTGVLKSQLYGVTATDPLTFAAVPVLLTCVALAATYLPARRATRVDPLVALRAE
ncbi:MAG TPA: ABC transporter permease [Candidatus Acidoferrales bacterium]|jgi:putative ABC transport system permease protein|nr:ABC transporter permease [Candidatus Acidoferrales bacterium]